MDHIDFIVTVHCKTCGEIASLAIPLDFEAAAEQFKKFKENHKHPKPNPWVV